MRLREVQYKTIFVNFFFHDPLQQTYIEPFRFFFSYLLSWLHGVLVAACRISFPDQGLNLGPLNWGHGALATGPPGKSQDPEDFGTGS